MSEESNGQSNGNGTSDWRAQVEASLAQITKQQEILNKLHLREEFRAAKARKEADERRKEADERMTRFETELAEFKRATAERAAVFERESAERKETLDYLIRLVRALGDKTFDHDDRLERAGAILSGDAANRTGI